MFRIYLITLLLLLSFNGTASQFLEDTHIYNNTLVAKTTFAILGQKSSGFIKTPVINKNIKYIFVVINGQQYPCAPSCLGENNERIFGRSLTGAHRVKQGVGWKGKYNIYSGKDDKYSSVAVSLFEQYRDSALVIDILNAKYNWASSQEVKKSVYKYVKNIIVDLAKAVETKTGHAPELMLTGFSRGAILAYKLTEELSHKFFVKALITIDPVINPVTERAYPSSMRFYNSKKREWQKTVPVFPLFPRFYDFYPVLSTKRINNRTKIFNVFQRRALLQPSGFKKPVGSAMERGKSPCLYEYYPCISYMRDEPEDQFDVGKSAHAPDMLDDYAGWILYIVKRTYEKPAYPAPPEPPVYIAPKIDYFSTGNIFFYAETHVTFHWRGNKPSLYYSTSVSRAGQVDKWTDWKKGYFSDSVMLGSPGTYTVKVKVKDDKGASLKIKTINVRARPPQISFKPVSPNIIFVGEKVSIDWMTDWNKNEFKYVLAIPNGDRIDGPAWSTNKHVEYQLDEIGNYLFSVEAKGKFNAKRRAGLPISVIDYIFSDEVIACGICLAEHSCSFTVAQLVKGPEETGDNTYIVKPTNNAALWESGVDMQTHFAIKKSFPVTLQTRSKLKVGQSVFWNGGNPPEAVGMRRRYMLGKILSLDKINKGMVTVRPYHGFVDFIEENKSVDVYYHNLRTFDETNLKNFKDTRPYCNGRWGVPKIEITRQRMVGPHGGTFSNLHPDQEGTFVWRSNVAGYYLKYAIKSKDGNPNNLKWSEWTKNLSGIKKSFKKLGEYEFLIMTKNHLGTISKEPVVIKFSVIKEK